MSWIGVSSCSSSASDVSLLDHIEAFGQGLRDLGYEAGHCCSRFPFFKVKSSHS
jgi:hypothetical protein